MGVAETCNCDAGEKIDVNVAVRVGQRRACAVVERNPREKRYALAARGDVLLFNFENFTRAGSGHDRLYRRQLIGRGRLAGNMFVMNDGAVARARSSGIPGHAR